MEFEEFYRAQWRGLVLLCTPLVGSRAVAEEVAQEALFVAHRRWNRVRSLDRPDLWLRRVAVNRCTSIWRRRTNEQRAYRRHQATPVPSGEPGVDASELWDLVGDLPTRQRAALLLHHVEDLDTREVGMVMGCSASTVQTHLVRARRTLAQRLSRGAVSPLPDAVTP